MELDALPARPDAPRAGIPEAENRSLHIRGQKLPSLWKRLPQEKNRRVVCNVGPVDDKEMFAVHLLNISQLLASYCEAKGGLLLHAALVCKGKSGIALLGGSGSGKTTASRRIPFPWSACCDDYTLVVRDASGLYWAHPWPTWSRFFQQGPGGSWPTEAAILLRAIFLLQPAADADQGWIAMPVSQRIEAILAAVEQATWSTTMNLDKRQRRSIRMRRLQNSIALAKSVPGYRLRLTLTGNFWEAMENALAWT
ncbi:MAG TPA: SynChlorMet cassette protein ScmC [Candidatus Binatia bacterium]|nr:SynChlorMet cassette protein ScmC [Candidatus Binatia bacterium]